jgi:hypothetical protein
MKIILLCIFLYISFVQKQQPQYSVLVPGSSWSYRTPDGAFDDYVHHQMFMHGKKSYFQNVRNTPMALLKSLIIEFKMALSIILITRHSRKVLRFLQIQKRLNNGLVQIINGNIKSLK